MEYNLLTVNNITKLCSTKIYVFKDEPIAMQWYNFQLNWLINKLNVTKEPMSLVAQRTESLNKSSDIDLALYNNLTNNNIFKLLKTKFKDNYTFENINGLSCHHITIPQEISNDISEDELIQYGFYSSDRVTINDIKNESYYGGFSNFTTSLNDNNTGIIMTTVETDEGLYGVQKHEIYSANFPFPNKLAADTTENKDTNVAKNMDELVVTQDKIDRDCIKGVFKWKNNSCYADSILMMIFRRIYNNNNGLLANTIKTPLLFDKYSIGDDMCSTESNRTENINNIIIELNKLLQQIDNNKVLHVEEFLNIMDKCVSGKEKFGNKETQSASEFLSKLVNIIYKGTLSELNQYKVDYDGMSRVVNIIEKTDQIDWSHHNDSVEKIGKILTDDESQIQIIEHQFLDIRQKLQKDQLYREDLDVVILRPSEAHNTKINKKINDIYGYNVQEKYAEHFLHNVETRGISIRNFFHQIQILRSTDDEGSVEFLRDLNNKFIVEELLITEKASDVFIFINRNSTRGTNNLNSINRLKIYPEENVDINGVAFELSGITYMPKTNHFGCLFKCNNKYYTYDDMRKDNWLELIGTIDNVVSNNLICNTSSIYHYTKVISQ